MTKDDVKWLWMTAWGAALYVATRFTRTRLDDLFCAAMKTEESFEDFWTTIVNRGLAKGPTVNATALKDHVDTGTKVA